MKTYPNPARPALQADPRIVRKARRDRAIYGSCNGLPGAPDLDFLPQPGSRPSAPRFMDFGRPGL